MPDISPAYRPRKPQDSKYYQCVEAHFEGFEQIYDERFTAKYGFFRPYVKQVIYRYLDHDQDEWIPCVLEPDKDSKDYRKNWARLIQKIYEVDPLTCPKCHGPMAVIAFIEAEDVIEKILKHLGLWKLTPRPPPRIAKAQPSYTEPYVDYSDSQVPPSSSHYHPFS